MFILLLSILCLYCAKILITLLHFYLQICKNSVTPEYKSRVRSFKLSSQEKQDQESDPGETTGAQGGQDLVCYPVGVHPDVDPLQRVGSDEGDPGPRKK